MAGKKRRDKLENAAKVLQGLFENGKTPLASGFQRWKLEQNWEEVVGAHLSNYCRPVDYKKRVLIVSVSNPALLTELQFFRDTLKDKINAYMETKWVAYIRFVSE